METALTREQQPGPDRRPIDVDGNAATSRAIFSLRATMNKRRQSYFRNSLDLRDKVQVKILRKRLKVSNQQFASIARKSGSSISAITKEAKVI
ncbi:DUF3606 domain-containing protein [Bradyrhizobium sp. th.b2]|uniref:DUF3606 domain-containing protein n=1 Tax=Bradyrhizobium sp. th-b2 TaxID=172088 RepID=UPI001FD9778B|nr:DUF3606 domain-containing protein [Bradyrhizobium sp. th.b2]